MDTLVESGREIPVSVKTDILVVGGGAAGLAAAVTAARHGCHVYLIEKYGFLGGTLTSVTLGSFCGIFTVTEDEIIPVVKGFQEELIECLKKYEGALPPNRWLKTASTPYDVSILKRVADELISEAGVRIAYHTQAVSIVMEGDQVNGVIVENKNGRSLIKAKVVIDASGDGDIAAMAGAPYQVGSNGITQFPSAMFRMANVNLEKMNELTRNDFQHYFQQAKDDGYDLPRLSSGIHITPLYGVVHLNVTKIAREDGKPINPLSAEDLTFAEIEGRRQVFLYEEILRRYVPGFERAKVVDIGSQIGIREARLIGGEYTLSKEDILSYKRFDDVIACSAWPLEIHGSDNKTTWVWLEPGKFYTIPYRCLIPRNISNVLTAGRNISTTHEAQASTRVSAVCMAVGQAAGSAAYLALGYQNKVRDIPIDHLQSLLKAQNAFLG
ncbi:FAD-dependent oxidoreductase [Mesobacillus foraminis]|uniref:FAD dependent oxidoreductase n=1 Tax=Mesobacillus foraminis TaxID=279826 RepID=A0A4R2B148_9BACI|nr:FAD-dependent oxidoreductase [Mesobacillus foraminis]TCN19715.1 FAD dependent oxidoreductase [Mesobacillus foraminis]